MFYCPNCAVVVARKTSDVCSCGVEKVEIKNADETGMLKAENEKLREQIVQYRVWCAMLQEQLKTAVIKERQGCIDDIHRVFCDNNVDDELGFHYLNCVGKLTERSP